MIHYIAPRDHLTLDTFDRLFDVHDWTFIEFRDDPNRPIYGSRVYDAGSFFEMDKRHVIWGGSGHSSKRRAVYGAMAEAIERYCMYEAPISNWTVSFREVRAEGYNALDPSTIRLYSEEQEVLRTGVVKNLDRDTKLRWSWFFDAFTEEPILVPSLFNQPLWEERPVYCSASSNGNGCGLDRNMAMRSGLFELIERDAAMFYWWTKNCPAQIDLSSPSPSLAKVLDLHRPLLPYLTFFHTRTDLDLVSLVVVLRGNLKNRMPLLLMSGAARLDLVEALDRALSEMNSIVRQFAADFDYTRRINYQQDFDLTIWEFKDHVNLYAFNDFKKAYGFLFPSQPERISWRDLPHKMYRSHQEELEYVKDQFESCGLRLYFSELTPKLARETRLKVMRAYSPDLLQIDPGHKFRALGVPRLYSLPKKLGLKFQPVRFVDLNPYPHPFP